MTTTLDMVLIRMMWRRRRKRNNGTPGLAAIEEANQRLVERERRRQALEVELASYPKPRERRERR